MAWLKQKKIKRTYVPTTSKKEAQKLVYSTPRWVRLRKWYLMDHPLCEDCLEAGLTVPAVDIHHIIPWQRGVNKWAKITLAFDSENLRALCVRCHHKYHPNQKHNYDG